MTFFVRPLRCRSLASLSAWLVFAAGAGTVQLAAQDLPPAIEADRLLLQAEQQIQDEDYDEALATLDRILELQAEHNLEVPAPFWFNHARVAKEVPHPYKARSSAIRYLEVAGRGGEHYLAALEILNELEEPLTRLAAERESAFRALLRQAETTVSGRVFRDCSLCPVMVEVPPGSYMMGSPATEVGRLGTEGPQHQVTIGYAFAAGVYEVTFAEWDACVSAGGCGHWPRDYNDGRGRRPVLDVNWEDAQEYVAWISEETGEEYRLLSEAEWEYVARAGTRTARYWGESEAEQCRYANGSEVSCSDGYGAETAPAGSFEPNAFGLYDVLGNVGEWTEDCWNASYAGAPTDGRPRTSGDCSHRVLRGGSWG